MAPELIHATFTAMEIPMNGFIEIGKSGEVDGKCTLTGSIGNIFTDFFLSSWIKEGHNCSLLGFPNFGSLKDGTGVKGAMANKSADLSLYPTKIWESDIEHIDYSNPISVETLRVICSYNYTNHFDTSDLIHAYLDFHWSYYVSLIFTTIGLIFFWKICSNIASRISKQLRDQLICSRLPGHWILVCAILDQSQYPNVSRPSFSVLSTCTALFVFIALDCFMKNTMSADLSVMARPRVVQTYQDIIDREDLHLMFIPGWDEAGFFETALPGTMEHEIWKKRYMLPALSPAVIAEVWQPVIDQRMIFIARTVLALGAANLGLTKTREMGVDYIRALETKDETGKSFENAFMIQKDAHPVLKEFAFRRMYGIANSGILGWYMEERGPRLFGDSEIILDQYVSSKLFLPEPPEPQIKLVNVYIFFQLFVCCFIVSTISLICEILYYHGMQKVRMKKSLAEDDKYYGYRTRGMRKRSQEQMSWKLIRNLNF